MKVVVSLLLAISFFGVTTIAAITILLSDPVFPALYSALFPKQSSATRSFAHAVATATFISMPSGPEKLPDCLNSTACFTTAEKNHLFDVRRLYQQLVGSTSLIVAATLVFIISSRLTWQTLFFLIKIIAKVFLIATLSLALIGTLFWNQVFTLFHLVLFPGGNWSFPASSLLIRLYPSEFWQFAGGFLLALCLLGYLAICLWPASATAKSTGERES